MTHAAPRREQACIRDSLRCMSRKQGRNDLTQPLSGEHKESSGRFTSTRSAGFRSMPVSLDQIVDAFSIMWCMTLKCRTAALSARPRTPVSFSYQRCTAMPSTSRTNFLPSSDRIPAAISPDILAAIDRDIAEANENFHTTIEESFQPYLLSLQDGDLTFLWNDN